MKNQDRLTAGGPANWRDGEFAEFAIRAILIGAVGVAGSLMLVAGFNFFGVHF